MAVLHQPLEDDEPENLSAWLRGAFEDVNVRFFEGALDADIANRIELDKSWHLRGGAGGAHPGSNRIVLDPGVHFTRRDLCGTMIHEMLHLYIGDDEGSEEHSQNFVRRCLQINLAILESGLPCFCRLGEYDTALDRDLLAEAFDAMSEADLHSIYCCLSNMSNEATGWDANLLVADFRRCLHCLPVHTHEAQAGAQEADRVVGRLQCLATARSCRLALRSGYDTWHVKSRTTARYGAAKTGRDYQLFSAYSQAWSL